MKKTRKFRYPQGHYEVYVPQNSGLADELNWWGWYRIPTERVQQYKDWGFQVYYRPACGGAWMKSLMDAGLGTAMAQA